MRVLLIMIILEENLSELRYYAIVKKIGELKGKLKLNLWFNKLSYF